MPKLKVHRGAKKRIKQTASGKMIRSRAYGNHFLAKKSSARKRVIARPKQLGSGNRRNMKRALGI